MNLFKKFTALTVVVALVAVCFAGCHKKGEIAVTVGETEFTTGMYLAALYDTAMSAISTVASENEDLDTSAEGFYRDQKIDGKSFSDYVSENTLESLKNIVAVEKYIEKYELSLTEEEENSFSSNATAYWDFKFDYDDESNYSLGKYYEDNGVSKDTFVKIYRGLQLSEYAFDKMYGKDGKKPVTDEEIKQYFVENFLVVNSVSTSDYSSKTDEEKAGIKAKYEDYEQKINAGTVTFDAAYAELSGATNDDGSAATPTDSYMTEDSSDDFAAVKEMEVGKVKLITLDDDAGFKLIYKKDINADTEGVTTYDETIRHELKQEEFENELKALIKDVKVTENKSALSVVKINKINFDDLLAIQQTITNAIYQSQYSA